MTLCHGLISESMRAMITYNGLSTFPNNHDYKKASPSAVRKQVLLLGEQFYESMSIVGYR